MIKLKLLLENEMEFGSIEQPYWHPGENPTVDIVIIKKLWNDNYEVLLIKRGGDTETDKWAIPGGFVDTNAKKGEPFKLDKETLKDAAIRETKEETGVDLKSLQHKIKYVGKYQGSGRDPRDNDKAWSVSNLFYFLTNANSNIMNIEAGDDAKEVKWFKENELPNLAFDHKKLIKDALNKIKND